MITTTTNNKQQTTNNKIKPLKPFEHSPVRAGQKSVNRAKANHWKNAKVIFDKIFCWLFYRMKKVRPVRTDSSGRARLAGQNHLKRAASRKPIQEILLYAYGAKAAGISNHKWVAPLFLRCRHPRVKTRGYSYVTLSGLFPLQSIWPRHPKPVRFFQPDRFEWMKTATSHE